MVHDRHICLCKLIKVRYLGKSYLHLTLSQDILQLAVGQLIFIALI